MNVPGHLVWQEQSLVSDTIGEASVRIVPKELDRYGRTIADVYVTVGVLGKHGQDRDPPDLGNHGSHCLRFGIGALVRSRHVASWA